MSEEILEDVALHVRAELPEVDRVELVDHLLQHVGIDDLQHRVAEVLGDLGLVLHERRHVGEHLVPDEVAQVVAAPETPLGPPKTFGLLGKQAHASARTEPPLELSHRLLLVEELEVDQVGDLLDVGDRVGHPACPEDVGDPVELAAKTLVHLSLQLATSKTPEFRSSTTSRRPRSPNSSIPLPAASRIESGGSKRSSRRTRPVAMPRFLSNDK